MLLAVVTSFFGLFITAYLMRMSPHPIKGVALGDWQPVPEPAILWWNTLALLIASAGMQLARSAARRGQQALLRAGWLAGGVFALLFLAGQLAGLPRVAGRRLLRGRQSRERVLLRADHAARPAPRGRPGRVDGDDCDARSRCAGARSVARCGVELCAVYWHYLLVVWLVLFGLLLAT